MNTKLMRKVCLLCLGAAVMLFSVNVSAQDARVTLNESNASLKSVIEKIESQTRYLFAVGESVDVNQAVSVNVDKAPLAMALDQIVSGKDLVYSINGMNIVLSKKAAARPMTVTGQIKDPSGLPVPGASVFILGTTLGTVTDLDGNFSLDVPAEHVGGTIQVNSLGYEIVELPINGQAKFNLTVRESFTQLDQSVVTALGIKKSERSVTYNVQSVDNSAFLTREANMVNSLQGRLAGVQINATSAGPGAETKVVMRGSKSISNSNTALYTLDGIPLPTLSMISPGDDYSIYNGSAITGDGIANFNSDDFQSMSALVGASASALYGYKAQNGILMLTTRQAEKGVSVSYSTNTTFSDPVMLPELQSSYGAKAGVYASWGNALLAPQTWSVKDFFQTGYNTQHTVSLGIGRDNGNTYLSAGFNDARGVVPNNDYSRYNVTFSHTEDFLNDKLHLSVLAMYIKVQEQNMLAGGQYYNPLVPLYLMSPSDDINKYAVYERYDASRNFPVQYWSWGSQDLQMQNPFWIVNRNMFNTDKNRYLLGGSLKYDITDWMNISARVRTDYNNTLSEQRNYASTSGLYAGNKGRYFHDQSTTNQTYADILLNVDKTFGDNLIQFNANVGASIEDYTYRQTYMAGDLLGVPNLFTFNNMNTDKGFYKNTYRDQVQSIFATAQVGYRNMVFLDVTGRADWNSQLVNTKSMPIAYPSVGLSAILTDIFNVKSNWFTYAKIRGSYAEVGSPISRFLTCPTYPVSNGSPAENTYGVSDNFQPERTRSFEVGADVKLWNGKLDISATYYHSMTYNQVFTPELPASFRYSTYYVNSGRVDNKGIELSLELNQNIGAVEWKSNLIYSRNRNKIVDMLDAVINGEKFQSDQLSVGGTTGVQMWLTKGRSIGDLYVRGLKTDEHGFVWVSPTASTVVPAPVDGGIESLIYAGNINPSWTGSWRNAFHWNGLSLSFMIQARVGGVGVSLTEAALDSFGMSQRTADARDNGGALVNGQRIPAEAYYKTIGGNGASALGAYYTYSMTNIRLGEVTLGYDIPVQKWQNVIKGLNVSFVGRNLAMLYCKAPFDPEVASGAGNYATGIDYFSLPSTRNLGFSVKVTF